MVLTTHPLPVLSACPMQNKIASTGKGILAMDESNATCGKRLESIGLENTVENRQVSGAPLLMRALMCALRCLCPHLCAVA